MGLRFLKKKSGNWVGVLSTDLCVPISGIFHTIFQDVDIRINRTRVSGNHSHQTQLFHILNTLSTNENIRNTVQYTEGVFDDDMNPDTYIDQTNTGFIERQKMFSSKAENKPKIVHLTGILMCTIYILL